MGTPENTWFEISQEWKDAIRSGVEFRKPIPAGILALVKHLLAWKYAWALPFSPELAKTHKSILTQARHACSLRFADAPARLFVKDADDHPEKEVLRLNCKTAETIKYLTVLQVRGARIRDVAILHQLGRPQYLLGPTSTNATLLFYEKIVADLILRELGHDVGNDSLQYIIKHEAAIAELCKKHRKSSQLFREWEVRKLRIARGYDLLQTISKRKNDLSTEAKVLDSPFLLAFYDFIGTAINVNCISSRSDKPKSDYDLESKFIMVEALERYYWASSEKSDRYKKSEAIRKLTDAYPEALKCARSDKDSNSFPLARIKRLRLHRNEGPTASIQVLPATPALLKYWKLLVPERFPPRRRKSKLLPPLPLKWQQASDSNSGAKGGQTHAKS